MQQIDRVTASTLDVLATLLDAPTVWGLQVVKRSERGPGTVYPILDRLERLEWVTSHWGDEPDRAGPRRRYYALTEDGRAAAVKLLLDRRGIQSSQLRDATA